MQEVRNIYHGQKVDFKELASEGPPHKKTFTFQVTVDGVPVAMASGPSKKTAKQRASQEAVRRKVILCSGLEVLRSVLVTEPQW